MPIGSLLRPSSSTINSTSRQSSSVFHRLAWTTALLSGALSQAGKAEGPPEEIPLKPRSQPTFVLPDDVQPVKLSVETFPSEECEEVSPHGPRRISFSSASSVISLPSKIEQPKISIPHPEIDALIAQMNDRDYRLRGQAQLKLTELLKTMEKGTWEEHLQKGLTSKLTEVRLRSEEVRTDTLANQLWKGSKVTFDGSEAITNEALTKIQESTGNLVLQGDQYGSFKDTKISLSPGEYLYWEALGLVCRESGNKFRPHYDTMEPGLVVTAGEIGKYPVAITGPVRAQINSARRAYSEDLDFEQTRSDITHTYQISLQVMWESGLRIVAYRGKPELLLLRMNTGEEVRLAEQSANQWNVGGRGNQQLSMNLRIQPPKTSGTTIKELKVKWGVIAVCDMQDLIVTNLSSREPFYKDDVELRIESLEVLPGNRCEITILVNRDRMISEPREAFFAENELELYDKENRPYLMQGLTNSFDEDGARIRATFIHDSNVGPGTLNFRFPGVRSPQDVILTFHDVVSPSQRPPEK